MFIYISSGTTKFDNKKLEKSSTLLFSCCCCCCCLLRVFGRQKYIIQNKKRKSFASAHIIFLLLKLRQATPLKGRRGSIQLIWLYTISCLRSFGLLWARVWGKKGGPGNWNILLWSFIEILLFMLLLLLLVGLPFNYYVLGTCKHPFTVSLSLIGHSLSEWTCTWMALWEGSAHK